MSIWGKIIGGAIGFGIGGPIGALVGAAAGHFAIDKRRDGKGGIQGRLRQSQETRQVAFAVAVVALAAKLAKVDGHVSRDEVAAIRRVFQMPQASAETVGAIFNKAKAEAGGFEPYARQIAGIFADNRAVLEELLAALLMIAHADGVYHQAERRFLLQVAWHFGFDEAEFHRIEATFTGRVTGDESDPYEVLGVGRDDSDDEIKTVYRKLVRENHPDTLTAQGLPEDFVKVADKKMAEVNAAYDRIKKERGTV